MSRQAQKRYQPRMSLAAEGKLWDRLEPLTERERRAEMERLMWAAIHVEEAYGRIMAGTLMESISMGSRPTEQRTLAPAILQPVAAQSQENSPVIVMAGWEFDEPPT